MSPERTAARGQILVLFVIALFAILGMVALVVDGGNAFAQQRLTQNWTDGAAEAGTVQLMRRLAGTPLDSSYTTWDSAVVAAVNKQVSTDGLDTIGSIEYVDDKGVSTGAAGLGTIPANTWGVRVVASRTFDTFIARSVGIDQFTAAAQSTYITGYVQTIGSGNIIPLTVPMLWTFCDAQGDVVTPGQKWPFGPNNPVALPLCKNAPGNRGWLDWTPPGGGASELADSITDNSGAPTIRTPHWYYYPQTGNTNSGQVQTALEGLIGTDVFIPIFYVEAQPGGPILGTCDTAPLGSQTAINGCTSPGSGNGQNQWYLWVTVASFHLQGVHIQGGPTAACDPAGISGNNGSVGCLTGYWKDDVVPSEVEVGPNPPAGQDPSTALVGVQLFR